jgi:hypothetical protein
MFQFDKNHSQRLKDACFARKMGITTLTDLYSGSKVFLTRHPSRRHFLYFASRNPSA